MSGFQLLRVGTACALLAFTACSPSRSVNAQSVRPDKDRKTAPEFSLKDANGVPVKLSDFKGKVVVLNFWATWCGPCKVEIPWFIEFEQKHKDQGLVVLGVSMDDDGWASVKPYIENAKVNYRVVIGTDRVGEMYGGVESLPTTFMVDREGKIASTHIGLIGKREYQDEINQLLGVSAAGL